MVFLLLGHYSIDRGQHSMSGEAILRLLVEESYIVKDKIYAIATSNII